MKKLWLLAIICLFAISPCFSQGTGLLIDNFSGEISGGPEGSVDFGAGNGSQIEVTASTEVEYSGKPCLEVTYNAVSGGYMWVARGTSLDAKNAGWLVNPGSIEWNKYKAISFYMYGSNAKTKVAFDIKDNGNEMWRFIVEDNFQGWKKITCPFNEFLARTDWQPDGADKNASLDFPLKSFQFEPLPEAKGTLYFAQVELE